MLLPISMNILIMKAFFNTFEREDIKSILEKAQLTHDQYFSLLKQSSSTITFKDLYAYTHSTKISIQSFEEAISVLKSITKYMRFNTLNGIIDFLEQKQEEILNSSETFRKLREELNNKDRLNRVFELEKNNDFEGVYKSLEELANEGKQDIMTKLLGNKIWEMSQESGRNILHVACEKGNLRLVKSFVESGCDLEIKNKRGLTPLICELRSNQLEVVNYLLSVGDDKDAKDKDGWTPLMYASFNGQIDVVKNLLTNGADKEAKNNNGYTPLMLASQCGHLEVVKYLVFNGANINVKANDGKTALKVAKDNVKDYFNSIAGK
ncbi:hypothetical protein TVAG_295270 [Trichomonas vaginalis G3]|uniref:Uncharacterized protein n=1 Tax=Trichomonas vaginalis (strain ATCC PRA-98 / G3) TaxID=412133 RepID=A2DL84_TRIV3|nr:spectrin binding [Trichomonas vaginalis G3]EAY18875.1 hypothetical protein TVAG_295270 [Trichomonas vaginalis G3]KAI5526006.1 spectrin binding [Trichomonas vaginalis G3]|eukprot:XP_001579861.1 hypothetical protein [Trichomonas vaginalis G3]